MVDYTNAIFGDYRIIRYLGNQTWEAKCEKCGLIRTYKTPSLKGKCICTCSTAGINIGEKYGRLTVLYRDLGEHTQRRVYWMCQCDCGNTIAVTGKSLKSGNTRSCGCLNDETRSKRIVQYNNENAPSLIGKTSGYLTVIREATTEEIIGRPQHIGYWYCECKCGNHHIVATSDFTRGKVQSCGCLNSKGEAKIAAILEKEGVSFAKQFTFPELHNKQNKPYAYDFAVLKNGKVDYLIEFDGIQHFSADNQFSKENGEESLRTIQARDKIKDEYALTHQIPLIRIPYTKFDSLQYEDLVPTTSKFIIKGR